MYPAATWYPGHVWSYDFGEGRTHDGRKFRILLIIDEASRECLALPVTETAAPPRPPSGSASLHRRPAMAGGDKNALTSNTDHSLGPVRRLLHMITSLSCATFNPRRFVIEDFRKSNAPPGPRYWCFSKAR